MKNNKELSSQEYLGCNISTLKAHIEIQFVEGMTWDNHGSKWHIDHKIPLKYRDNGNPPSIEEVQTLTLHQYSANVGIREYCQRKPLYIIIKSAEFSFLSVQAVQLAYHL